jgi:hypothetical protein
MRRGQPDRAARLMGAGAALREAIRLPRPPTERDEYETLVADLRAALGEDGYADAWDRGRALSVEQAIDYAIYSPAPSRGPVCRAMVAGIFLQEDFTCRQANSVNP